MRFGSVCVGETIKKSVVVHNNGALPACFAVTPVTSLEQSVTIKLHFQFKYASYMYSVHGQKQ